MRTLMNPANGQQVTVPDNVAADYTSRGWVAPGAPALATPPEEETWPHQPGSDTTVNESAPASAPAVPSSTSKPSNASSKSKPKRRRSGRPDAG